MPCFEVIADSQEVTKKRHMQEGPLYPWGGGETKAELGWGGELVGERQGTKHSGNERLLSEIPI